MRGNPNGKQHQYSPGPGAPRTAPCSSCDQQQQHRVRMAPWTLSLLVLSLHGAAAGFNPLIEPGLASALFGYEKWGFGEPNNHNDNEHCAEVHIYNTWHWNDAPCEAYNDWICQIDKAFLTIQMLNYNEDYWIGMNDVNWEMHFVWTDGKAISYTNWAKGHPKSEPDGRFTFNDELFDCVIMVGSNSKMSGVWKVEDCHSKQSFICKRNSDSQIVVPATTVLPKAFHKLGNDSYKLVALKMKWDEARRQCQADDADLVSILNPITQAYVTLQIFDHNEPVWIGLNSNEHPLSPHNSPATVQKQRNKPPGYLSEAIVIPS
ncbi:Macrophage mannose receptor 1 [Liparis tanakae]|uniref:Macrophage mannose receptor 1 n=1 Tax=Liparis tanakae TaxID=230148 RepID=A0A4Z2GXT2_9TELE|nr:Macrophage mannose receptor 1 [Liparis tanakae]